jgi:NTP pyrophosphatase (non-canonical NTP hydrolase)
MDIVELTAAVEEISRGYAARFGFERTGDWHLLKLQEEVGELTQAHLMREGQARAKGRSPSELDADFCAEVADVLCQTLILANHHGVDVVAAVRSKWLVWSQTPQEPQTSQGPPPAVTA